MLSHCPQVHDQDKLAAMLLHSLSPELCEGLGQLLFEWCRGVTHQFHSCCEPVLSLLLGKMGCVELPEQLVFESLCVMVRAMAGHTKREFAGPLWLPLLVREAGSERERERERGRERRREGERGREGGSGRERGC